MDQAVQLRFLAPQRFQQMLIGKFRHVLLGVVDPGGQVGVQVLQHGLDGADAFCQPPIQGRLGQRGTLAAVGGDDFHHGLSLGQRHAAMLQPGPAGAVPAVIRASSKPSAIAVPPWTESSMTSSPV